MNVEDIILSGCLSENILKIQLRVRPEFFTDDLKKKLFKYQIQFYSDNGFPASKETLSQHIDETYNSAEKTVLSPVISGLNENIDRSLVTLNVRKIVDEYQFGQYKKLAKDIVAGQARDVKTIEAIIQKTQSDVSRFTNIDFVRENFTSEESYKDFIEIVEEAEKPQTGNRFFSGIRELDLETGGARKGQLWLYCAAAGHGKTTIVMNHLHHMAVEQGLNGVLFSLEMTKTEMKIGFNAMHACKKFGMVEIDTKRIERGQLSKEDKEKLLLAAKDLTENKKYGRLEYVQVPIGISAANLHLFAEQINKEFPLHAIFIDYISKLAPVKPRKQLHEEHGETIAYIKHMAISFNNGAGVFIGSAHQMNRTGYEKARKIQRGGIYYMNELAMTAEAERSSDLIISIFKASQLEGGSEDESSLSKEDNELILALLKHRSGQAWPDFPKFNVHANLKAKTLTSFDDLYQDVDLQMPMSEVDTDDDLINI